jgi:Tfp pilus assembly protein PilN
VAISINLLHEKHKQERQRQRDPLKLGVYVLGGIIAFFLAYYLFAWFGAQRIFNQRDDLRAQWDKKQRETSQVTQLETEMKSMAAASTALNNRIERRFFWGPFLDVLYRVVPPEIQLTSFSGASPRKNDMVIVQLDGIAAGAEPRAVAEKFRLALQTALDAKYREIRERSGLPIVPTGVSCQFRQLEDQSGVTAKIEGKELPTAKFVMEVKLRKPFAPAPPPPTTPAKPKSKG